MFLKPEGRTLQRRWKAKYNILREKTGSFNNKIFRQEIPLLIRTNNKNQKCILAQGEEYAWVFFLVCYLGRIDKHTL